jgi:hypothetical protein
LRQIVIKLDLQTSYYEDILQLSLKNFKNRVEGFSPRSLLEEGEQFCNLFAGKA